MRYVSLIAAALLILAGCTQQSAKVQSGRLRVVATTGMIVDAVRHIGGDRVEVDGLMGPGVDPHLYKATKGDIDLLDKADIIFYNGLYLEAKLTEILERMTSQRTTVAIGTAVDSNKLRYPSQFEGHPDPHIWFDLALWSQAVSRVAEVLESHDTANAQFYRSNARSYLDSLAVLDSWVREQIAAIPEQQCVLITAHDAFEYFGRAYGIEVRGLQGISTVTEAGLQDVTAMVDFLVDRRIKAVFVESSVPKRTIEAVVDGCRARGHTITIGGELFSDAMGQAGTEEGTFFGMVRHNVTTIAGALQ